MTNTVRLENWSIVMVPGVGPRLSGTVYGHPRLKDGEKIVVSSILERNRDNNTVQTMNTLYVLGHVDPEWDRLYPDSVNRFWNS